MTVFTPIQLRAKAQIELRKRRGIRTPRTPQQQAIYDRCRYNLEAFATEFFPHLCRNPFSDMHRDFFAREAEILWNNERDLREATAAPRGNAKTTILGFIKLIHDCVYHLETFIVLFSATAELAEDRVKQLRDELEFNTHLVEVFGNQTSDIWNQNNFVTTPDAYSGVRGVRVKAASPGSQVRGLLDRGERVSKIFLDDFETGDGVITKAQREKTLRKFSEDITKLGQPGTNIGIIGTILHPDSLLSNLLVNAGYHARIYRSVKRFANASALPLWQQWKSIFTNLDDVQRVANARAFFEANEAAMLNGAEVLWSERESYYDLMVLRIVGGETAFQVEKQNNPLRSEGHLFDMAGAGYFTLTPTGLQRQDGRHVQGRELTDIVAYWDPAVSEGKDADWSVVVVVGSDASGYLYVLEALMMHSLSPTAQDARIIDLLWRWRVRRFGSENNNFQSLALRNVQNALAARCQEEGEHYAPIWAPVHNSRNKMLRISTLDPLIRHQHLWFCATLDAEFLRQLSVFQPIDGADKDDGPDALEGAVRLMKHME